MIPKCERPRAGSPAPIFEEHVVRHGAQEALICIICRLTACRCALSSTTIRNKTMVRQQHDIHSDKTK